MAKSTLEMLEAIHLQASKGLVEYYHAFLSEDEGYAAPAPFHYQISDILINKHGHFAIEMFRESAKSTYVLKTFPLYRLTYPIKTCRYIVIIKNTQTSADAKLKEIADEYCSNTVMNQNMIKVHKRSASIFEISVMGLDGSEVRMRIEAYGKGASIRGLSWGNLRPQFIICDDIQDLEDTNSDTVQEKDWDWFLSDINFLAKNGRIVIIGNNLGERCIVERIINQPELDYNVLKIPAIEDGKSTWPAAFSFAFLQREKEQFTAMGKIDIWYRERMCVAIPEEMKVFKKEYFKYFEEEDLINKNLDFYITVDLAISEKETADDTVLCVVGKEKHKPNWYVMECVGGRITPLQTIDALFKLYEVYRPIKVGIESVAYQKALSYFIEEEMRKRGIYFAITDIKSKNKKEERIKGLQPMFKTGVVLHRKNMIKLEEQLLSFPKGLHDDYIDALSMHIELMDATYKKRYRTTSRKDKYVDPLKRI